jgi:tetratricopeptide (TPR) repeat protein
MSKAKTRADDKPRWLVQFEGAQALVAGGESRGAAAPLRRALELNPRLAAGWALQADIAMASGDFAAGLHAQDHAIAATLRSPRLEAAAVAISEHRLTDAEHGLRDRAEPFALLLLGEVMRRQNRLAEAEGILRGCIAAAPDLSEARRSLAETLFGGRRFAEALAEFDRVLKANPENVRSLAMKAAALTEIGRHGEAADVAAKVVQRFSDQPHAWLVRAGALRALGQTAAAIAAYHKCVALDPGCAEAWLCLANLKTYRFAESEVANMETLLATGELPPEDRAKLAFALGKAREDKGDHAGAFEAYALGNAIEKPRRAFDPDQTSAYVRRCAALFTPAFFAARPAWGAPAPEPIFIVGLPRSGSTLVEQILASHAAIEGAGELPDLPMVAAGIGVYPEGLAKLPREVCARLGRDYLGRAATHRQLARPRFVDKTPKNFLHIGFIRLTLPNARIIDVRRHPLDCGVSIFRQHFGVGFNSAFDLEHIGRYYADYVRLMAHFDLAAPGAVHRVIYEDLVSDTEREVRRMLDYLGLPFDPACLRFFENRRAVDTPSSEQVRQPIFTEAVGQWRRFEPWLDPLKSALGPVLVGYPGPPDRPA